MFSKITELRLLDFLVGMLALIAVFALTDSGNNANVKEKTEENVCFCFDKWSVN